MQGNLLVTGCAGFIGFHFVRDLLETTDLVVHGVDDFSRGKFDA